MENQDKKRQQIIEAAIKRFAHFGLAKTTMTEIAADLSLSKALLYYYFPDKISLYSAVLENIVDEVNAGIIEGMSAIKGSKESLYYFLEKRQEYIRKYYNILDYIRISGADLPDSVVKILEKAKDAEVDLISSAIEKGIRSKEFKIKDAADAAGLLMEAFIGMRYVLFSNKLQFQVPSDQFEILLERQKKLASIFLRGLK